MFDWNDYLTLARHLLSHGTEASYRSAVSRAYYAAFNAARRWLEQYDPQAAAQLGSHSHENLWKYFKRTGGMHMRLIGEGGTRLRELRNEMDYNDLVPDLTERAEDAVSNAALLIDRLGRLA